MFKKIAAILAVFCMACMFTACSSSNSESEGSAAANTESTEEVTEGSVEGGQKYLAEINVKDYGTITVELDEGIAPETVKNFVKLANEGFYDGLTFHRIIEGFMIQGGDPNGNGTGGSDETIKGEFLANGFNNTLSHTRGVISMARSSAYDSASSQFFIMQEDGTYLDGQYAAFGTVIDGMDVVDAIAEQAEPTDNNGTIESDEQPVIESITITEE
jgi:peptidyl-prolyl cis-trans isomerase B (cyclophilin B)